MFPMFSGSRLLMDKTIKNSSTTNHHFLLGNSKLSRAEDFVSSDIVIHAPSK